MELKHTKGKWRWGRAGGDCSIYADRFCKKQIAQLTQIDGDNRCEEMDGNAKLMAAAPEMIEAILYYFDVLKEVMGDNWDKNPDHVLAKMLKAYKKATDDLPF